MLDSNFYFIVEITRLQERLQYSVGSEGASFEGRTNLSGRKTVVITNPGKIRSFSVAQGLPWVAIEGVETEGENLKNRDNLSGKKTGECGMLIGLHPSFLYIDAGQGDGVFVAAKHSLPL